MATYERQTRVRAPLDDVWAFNSTVAGLRALTPDWMELRVESVTGPDGASDPEVLEVGCRLRLSVRPFGVGPRRRWLSEIVERESGERSAYFRDEMREGPFPRWIHTHAFFADGEETVVRDRVAYDLPGGEAGRRLGPLAAVGFEPMFRYRHRRLRELLEPR